MTGNPVHQIHLAGAGAGAPRSWHELLTAAAGVRVVRTAGRHQAGGAGLRRCVELASVQQRLDARRGTGHASRHRRHQPRRRGVRISTMLAAAGAAAVILVSGWYTAAGAAAVAQMVSP